MYRTTIELRYNGTEWVAQHVRNIPPEHTADGNACWVESCGYGPTPHDAVAALERNSTAHFPPRMYLSDEEKSGIVTTALNEFKAKTGIDLRRELW